LTRKLGSHPLAELELIEAAPSYEERGRGLGATFLGG
jgi:hypothetical protein